MIFTKITDENAALLLVFEEASCPPPESLLPFLQPSQLERSLRFKRPLRRSQYLWSRLMLAAAVRADADQSGRPRAVIEEKPPQAPVIRLGSGEVFTSVSHSGERVHCLLAAKPCAVDVERYAPERPLERYAEAAFSAETAAALKKEADLPHAFFKAWGAYECAVKLGRPREFIWVRHEPAIEGFRVESKFENGWSMTAALSPEVPQVREIRLTAAALQDFFARGAPLFSETGLS